MTTPIRERIPQAWHHYRKGPVPPSWQPIWPATAETWYNRDSKSFFSHWSRTKRRDQFAIQIASVKCSVDLCPPVPYSWTLSSSGFSSCLYNTLSPWRQAVWSYMTNQMFQKCQNCIKTERCSLLAYLGSELWIEHSLLTSPQGWNPVEASYADFICSSPVFVNSCVLYIFLYIMSHSWYKYIPKDVWQAGELLYSLDSCREMLWLSYWGCHDIGNLLSGKVRQQSDTEAWYGPEHFTSSHRKPRGLVLHLTS